MLSLLVAFLSCLVGDETTDPRAEAREWAID